MRDVFKKAGALGLGVSGLGFLMVHAALANGCQARSQAPEPHAPTNAGPENGSPPPAAYMGATKAPPMDYFHSVKGSSPPPAAREPAQQAQPAQQAPQNRQAP
jgi:hypothetical protein